MVAGMNILKIKVAHVTRSRHDFKQLTRDRGKETDGCTMVRICDGDEIAVDKVVPYGRSHIVFSVVAKQGQLRGVLVEIGIEMDRLHRPTQGHDRAGRFQIAHVAIVVFEDEIVALRAETTINPTLVDTGHCRLFHDIVGVERVLRVSLEEAGKGGDVGICKKVS